MSKQLLIHRYINQRSSGKRAIVLERSKFLEVPVKMETLEVERVFTLRHGHVLPGWIESLGGTAPSGRHGAAGALEWRAAAR